MSLQGWAAGSVKRWTCVAGFFSNKSMPIPIYKQKVALSLNW